MVSLLHVSVAIFFLCFPLQVVTSDVFSPTYILPICSRSNYTKNSVYENNLNLVLANLSSTPPLTNFYNSTYGESVDKVYYLLFCPEYITAKDCQTCIRSAVKNITQECPNSKRAIVYFVECYLRYGNTSFFSLEDQNGQLSIYSWGNIKANPPDQFNMIVTNEMNALIIKATFGSLKPTFAKGEANINASHKVYCFVQCFPDVTASICDRRLRAALTDLSGKHYGEEELLTYGPNYQMRHSLEPFYDVAPTPSLAPPANPTVNSTTTTNSSSQPSSGKKRITTPIIIAIISAATLAILAVFIATYLIRRKVRTSRKVTENADSTPSVESLHFDYGTIRDATDNFSNANKLGEGGFGPVYKGVLSNGQDIAVKKLSGNSKQGQEEFKNEVLLLARLRHTNLVGLLGYCFKGKEKLLIYEFMPNNSLDHFMFDPIKRAYLDWTSINRIIQGIAQGLLYLHEESKTRIIHRDLKTSNILLDAEMEPKIADFGTARLMILDESHYTASKIMGTIGYMPPEYFKRGHFSVKSDVFSFGVILLEILSGQKICSFRDKDIDENLLSYAWKCWMKNTPLDIVDSTLMSGPKIDIVRYLNIGLLCVQENAADRPTMALVVNMLSSSSLTLSVPSRPAFFVAEKLDLGNFLDESSSTEKESYQSENKSAQCTINEVTITDLEAR